MDAAQILRKCRTIAVVGCSKDPVKPGNYVTKYMIEAGYEMIPVNPTADEILGRKCYHSLGEIPQKVDVVDVFRPAAEALEIAKQAAQIGAWGVWLQEGIISQEAHDFARQKGLEFIENKCMMKEHRRMV